MNQLILAAPSKKSAFVVRGRWYPSIPNNSKVVPEKSVGIRDILVVPKHKKDKNAWVTVKIHFSVWIIIICVSDLFWNPLCTYWPWIPRSCIARKFIAAMPLTIHFLQSYRHNFHRCTLLQVAAMTFCWVLHRRLDRLLNTSMSSLSLSLKLSIEPVG